MRKSENLTLRRLSFLLVVWSLLSSSRMRFGCAFPIISRRIGMRSTRGPNKLRGSRQPTALCLSDASSAATTTRTLEDGSHCSELVVKKSRFLAHATHVDSWDDAQEYFQKIKAEHPKARHWCYGYCGGVNPVNERCYDDGEPTGTAGLPILGAIQSESLSDTLCVVVRYFGGIKLGAGGLIRAYGGAARQILREAPVKILIPKSTIRIQVDGKFVGSIYEVAAKFGGVPSGEEYDADGNLAISITCETAVEEAMRQLLQDSTRGQAVFIDEN